MDTIIYLNATIKLHFGGLAIYECENGFIGFCDARCGDIGDNPMISDKSEMISIDRLPFKWREKIKEELKNAENLWGKGLFSEQKQRKNLFTKNTVLSPMGRNFPREVFPT